MAGHRAISGIPCNKPPLFLNKISAEGRKKFGFFCHFKLDFVAKSLVFARTEALQNHQNSLFSTVSQVQNPKKFPPAAGSPHRLKYQLYSLQPTSLVTKFRPKAVPDFFKDVSVFNQILFLETVFYACLEHQKILHLEFI